MESPALVSTVAKLLCGFLLGTCEGEEDWEDGVAQDEYGLAAMGKETKDLDPLRTQLSSLPWNREVTSRRTQ